VEKGIITEILCFFNLLYSGFIIHISWYATGLKGTKKGKEGEEMQKEKEKENGRNY
jgi:hypothetical protein